MQDGARWWSWSAARPAFARRSRTGVGHPPDRRHRRSRRARRSRSRRSARGADGDTTGGVRDVADEAVPGSSPITRVACARARSTTWYVSTSFPRPARSSETWRSSSWRRSPRSDEHPIAHRARFGDDLVRARPGRLLRLARLRLHRLLRRGLELTGALLSFPDEVPRVLLGLRAQFDGRLARLAEHACRLLAERGDEVLVRRWRRRRGQARLERLDPRRELACPLRG